MLLLAYEGVAPTWIRSKGDEYVGIVNGKVGLWGGCARRRGNGRMGCEGGSLGESGIVSSSTSTDADVCPSSELSDRNISSTISMLPLPGQGT